MAKLGRAIGVFLFMLVSAYALVLIALPRPSPAASEIAPGGQIAAARLSHEARFLVGHRTLGEAR